jgi:hypothetical protein
MSGPVRQRLRTALVLLTAGVALTACSTSRIQVRSTIDPTDADITFSATPTDTASGTATDPSADATAAAASAGADLTGRLSVQAGDLPGPWTGMRVQLSPDGDKLAGQSLDNCGYTFASEKFRVARRMTGVYDAAGKEVGVYNEVVVYDSDSHAMSAMREWKASVGNCHKGTLIKPTAKGDPKIRVESETTTTDATLPVADNTVTSQSATVLGATRTRLYGMFVVQLRGAVLDVVLMVSPTPFTRADITGLTTLAQATGKRLADS